jgi:hypothetical protein
MVIQLCDRSGDKLNLFGSVYDQPHSLDTFRVYFFVSQDSYHSSLEESFSNPVNDWS